MSTRQGLEFISASNPKILPIRFGFGAERPYIKLAMMADS